MHQSPTVTEKTAITSTEKIRKKGRKEGEMAQWLGALIACRGLRFDSQHSHDDSQPSITLVPGYVAGTQAVHIQAGKMFAHIK